MYCNYFYVNMLISARRSEFQHCLSFLGLMYKMYLLKSELKKSGSPNSALLFLGFIGAFLLSPFSIWKGLVGSTQLQMLYAITE